MTDQETFLDLCNTHIHRAGLEELLNWLEAGDFFTAPASARYHGNYVGGLCAHSLNVYDTLCFLSERYAPELSEESLAIVGLFHDVCKINTYELGTRRVKENNVWKEKEVWVWNEKFPFGHGEKSRILLQRFMKLTTEELLAIRWHMGGYDYSVQGGAHGNEKAAGLFPLVSLLQAADSLASSLLEETR